MADITENVKQIRSAVYGKDVRESIASGIEVMNTDNIKAIESANTAIETANTAAANANDKATAANTAAQEANKAKSDADAATGKANKAASDANSAASNANTKAGEANNAASTATTAANNVNKKLQELQTKLNNGDFNGATVHHGTSAPATSIGKVNDWYVDTSNGDYYHKTSNGWVKDMSLKSPTTIKLDGVLQNELLAVTARTANPSYVAVQFKTTDGKVLAIEVPASQVRISNDITLDQVLAGNSFYISHVPGESITEGNYTEWVAAGKPAMPTNFN